MNFQKWQFFKFAAKRRLPKLNLSAKSGLLIWVAALALFVVHFFTEIDFGIEFGDRFGCGISASYGNIRFGSFEDGSKPIGPFFANVESRIVKDMRMSDLAGFFCFDQIRNVGRDETFLSIPTYVAIGFLALLSYAIVFFSRFRF